MARDFAQEEKNLRDAEAQEARFHQDLEEFVGPSDPEGFTLFLMPPPESKYLQQMLKSLDILKEGIELGEITEFAYCALKKDDWISGYTGSSSRLRMAGAIMDLAIDRLGYTKG